MRGPSTGVKGNFRCDFLLRVLLTLKERSWYELKLTVNVMDNMVSVLTPK